MAAGARPPRPAACRWARAGPEHFRCSTRLATTHHSFLGSFSAGSKRNFATKYSFFQIFRDLQDSQNGFLEFCKFSQNFAKFSWNFLIFGHVCWNRSKSVILACNFHEIWSELREITDNSRNSMTIAEFFEKSRKSVKFFKKLAKNELPKVWMCPLQQRRVSINVRAVKWWGSACSAKRIEMRSDERWGSQGVSRAVKR